MDTSSVNTESKFRVEFHSCLNNNKVQRWVIWHKQLIMKAKVNLCAGNHYVNFYFEFWNASFELLILIVLNYKSCSVQSLLLAIPPRRKYAFQPLHIVICTHCVTISSALYSFWYFIGSEFRRIQEAAEGTCRLLSPSSPWPWWCRQQASYSRDSPLWKTTFNKASKHSIATLLARASRTW
jgi:hypothetical protein